MASLHYIYHLQTEPVGATVERFHATDPDFGPEGEVEYSLEQRIPDENTGVIATINNTAST